MNFLRIHRSTLGSHQSRLELLVNWALIDLSLIITEWIFCFLGNKVVMQSLDVLNVVSVELFDQPTCDANLLKIFPGKSIICHSLLRQYLVPNSRDADSVAKRPLYQKDSRPQLEQAKVVQVQEEQIFLSCLFLLFFLLFLSGFGILLCLFGFFVHVLFILVFIFFFGLFT